MIGSWWYVDLKVIAMRFLSLEHNGEVVVYHVCTCIKHRVNQGCITILVLAPIALYSTVLHHLQSSQADAALFPMTAPKDCRSLWGKKNHTKDTWQGCQSKLQLPGFKLHDDYVHTFWGSKHVEKIIIIIIIIDIRVWSYRELAHMGVASSWEGLSSKLSTYIPAMRRRRPVAGASYQKMGWWQTGEHSREDHHPSCHEAASPALWVCTWALIVMQWLSTTAHKDPCKSQHDAGQLKFHIFKFPIVRLKKDLAHWSWASLADDEWSSWEVQKNKCQRLICTWFVGRWWQQCLWQWRGTMWGLW